MINRISCFFALALLIFACGETKQPTTPVAEEPIVEAPVEEKSIHEKDWEKFKTALLNKDMQGVAAFASSDAVDAEALLLVMGDETLLKTLKETSFADLKVNETEQGEALEFFAQETAIDEDGNEVGSAISIFFTKGEGGLELDYFAAAG